MRNDSNKFVMDLINAIALYKAKEAGAFGREKVEIKELGILSATLTDIQETSIKYLKKEITKERAKEEIKNTIKTSISTYITNFSTKIINKGIDAVANFLKKKMPILSGVINAGKEYVKRTIGQKIKEVANKVGEKIGNIFTKIFGK